MPELPEVEVVRRGVEAWTAQTRITDVEVLAPRVTRRHLAGPEHLITQLDGQLLGTTGRRGKFMWLTLPDSTGLVIHLGMSGQILFRCEDAVAVGARSDPRPRHLRFAMHLHGLSPQVCGPNCGSDRSGGGRQLWFVDQRQFGGVFLDALGPSGTPSSLEHIAADPFDPMYDIDASIRRVRRSRSPIKTRLLDQSVVSGIGNIYADEALWRSRVHPARSADSLSVRKARELLVHARDVMAEAINQGGTSFDALYVNVNGQSGYFSRSLSAYGRAGLPCQRECGSAIACLRLAGRSSHYCPRCQRPQ